MDYSFTPILLDRYTCRDFERSSRLEWVNTNNTGAYAMGTVAGVNTRRYHGLLVATLDAPTKRHVVVAKIDETVHIDGHTYQLGTNQYPGAAEPQGFSLLDKFELDPFPHWSWDLGTKTFSKSAFLIKGRQAVAVVYSASSDCVVRARPFIANRPFHDLIHASPEHVPDFDDHQKRVTLAYTKEPRCVYFDHNAKRFEPDSLWYYNFEYLAELERGMGFKEDLYTPGEFVFEMSSGKDAFLVASIDGGDPYDLSFVEDEQRTRRDRYIVAHSPFEAKLTSASDQFHAVRKDGLPTVMAGFPWFASWARDAMISLPGIYITRGQLDDATKVIEGFLVHLNQGIIPNHYPDFGTPEYNTCDATLWMFQAVWSYMKCGGNLSWIEDVFLPAARKIIAWHKRGTLFEIHMDPEDGLLSAGVEGIQLTWMDAIVDNWVVTPRRGKPVEVNALWYNALRMTSHWAVEFGDMDWGQELTAMANHTHETFAKKFWNPELNCLYDVLGAEGPDPTLRPNQLFAVSLPFDLLSAEQERAVVDIVERELLTPVGLRSLARSDPNYHPRYVGDRLHRDSAYHQGTVWPWLLGPFITAYMKVHGESTEARHYCRRLVAEMEPETLVAGLGTISEIYDAEPPHIPRGCIAQAWSVAELLRVLRTDLV